MTKLQSISSSSPIAKQKPKSTIQIDQLAQNRKNKKTYPACDDDPSDNRNEGHIGKPSLPLQGHEVGKNRGEERRCGPNSLVEGNRQEAEGDVAEDDRDAEDEAEGGDLEKLDPGPNCLHGDHLHPRDGYVAEQRASGHMAHGEEDRVLEAVVAEQVLIQQEHPNVGGVP